MARNRPLIVGIGASAGGVEALQAFLRAMPADCGMAFVIVTHLGERHQSALPEILARCTAMPVVPARNGDTVETDHVYVLAADALLTLERGCVRLRTHRGAHRERHTIDVFFTSLAEDAGENAIAVVLSGLGNDGTLGSKAIKERGGLTIAQRSEDGAPKHPEMPANAIASGVIDMTLPVEAMGAKLVEYSHGLGRLDTEGQPRARRDRIGRSRQAICKILLDNLGHNFEGYKERTMLRRIERRMQVLELEDIEAYVSHLEEDRGEIVQLFHDLLIGVTAFFRDHEAFDALAQKIVPQLFEGKGAGDAIRVWVPGCSTGEEVYSLAILLLEHMATLKARPIVQCFATEIDDNAIGVARAARYPAAMLRDVGPERLQRYFNANDGIYTVAREVRELCVFSSHSVIRDPPFSRIDLVSCRNLLIYLDTDLQSYLVPVFHYALRPGGYLFLGSSENLTRHGEFFAPIDKRHRIFQRRGETATPAPFPLIIPGPRSIGLTARPLIRNPDPLPLRQSIERRVLERFAPAHVVVNRDGDIVHYSGRTGKYLEHAAGAPNRQLLAMARRGLRLELRAALNEAIETHRQMARSGIKIETEDSVQTIDLTVEPLPEQNGEPLFLVVFTDVGAPHRADEEPEHAGIQDRSDLDHLETELRDARDRLQSIVEEYETALEELKSANEELISTNEELQSTNEELETSREEIQSINEELNTVNAELQRKVEEIDRANDDLRNLLDSTPTGTVFLDSRLAIRAFTPAIAPIFKLIQSDLGRPLADIAGDLKDIDLRQEIEAVLHSRQGSEKRVRQRGGQGHYLMRILPEGSGSTVGGVRVSFIDITELVATEGRLSALDQAAGAMLDMVRKITAAPLGRGAAGDAAPESLRERLRCLAGLYRSLSQAGWGEVALRDLLAAEFGRFGDGTDTRVAIDGRAVMVRPKAAIALAMAFYELAANARAYGTLSRADGRVRIGWHIDEPAGAAARLVIDWRESGGPAVPPAPPAGFGGELIESTLSGEIGATVAIEFDDEGVRASIALPLSTGLLVVSATG